MAARPKSTKGQRRGRRGDLWSPAQGYTDREGFIWGVGGAAPYGVHMRWDRSPRRPEIIEFAKADNFAFNMSHSANSSHLPQKIFWSFCPIFGLFPHLQNTLKPLYLQLLATSSPPTQKYYVIRLAFCTYCHMCQPPSFSVPCGNCIPFRLWYY